MRKIWKLVYLGYSRFLGQLFFSARFIVQWIYSEINKKSIIPLAFWFFSILGGVTLLAYAIHRKDPVFILDNQQAC